MNTSTVTNIVTDYLVLSVVLSKSSTLPSTTQNSTKVNTKSNEQISIATSKNPRTTTARTVPTSALTETTITTQEKHTGIYKLKGHY